ncbi:uncharacterized protein LOC129234336 [Uloborus diversus]|uniref:uncharacterized protein LOC129234336 n=1 Tax=Uloborus diversus TaxID=327109 RepID=UPI00240A8919|nr:uncharacterized protein LOC129234336 [Uloborus diversus]
MSKDLVLSERLSDVTLKVRHAGFSWRLPAHSLMLVNRSSVFRLMMEERPEDEKPVPITVVSMEPNTAINLLRYVYTSEIPVELSADLIIASEKYGFHDLRETLEDRLLPDLSVTQACRILEELEQRVTPVGNCSIRDVCRSLIQRHALLVFGTDLVLELSKKTMVRLLQSDCLNVPDEAYLFWGIWRWGRMQCSKSNRLLTQESVATFLDELIVLISAWHNILEPKRNDEGNLCLQVSFDRDILLIGMMLEVGTSEQIEAYVRLFRETDGSELRRQRIGWTRCALRRTSPNAPPESWAEASLVFLEPLFLERNEIYSIYFQSYSNECFLPTGTADSRRKKIDPAFAAFHGDAVSAVRELYLVPNVTVTWGPRGPLD